jgi:hypothetical protein
MKKPVTFWRLRNSLQVVLASVSNFSDHYRRCLFQPMKIDHFSGEVKESTMTERAWQ